MFQFLTFLAVLVASANGLSPAKVKGYKFFDSHSGEELVVRGIDYYPRPNKGELNTNSVDYFTEEHRHIWERDIPNLKELGVNAIRLYAVNATYNHDAFMCALNAAGIYAIIALATDCPTCAITRDSAPECYPNELKIQGQNVINAFAKYENTLAFSAGNEVNHFAMGGPESNAPCQKKFLRDMREYIDSCPHTRHIPVGLVAADSDRTENTLYYNCAGDPDDEFENAEWFGLNSYVHCNGSVTEFKEAAGFQTLTEDFESYNYSIPVLLTEFGCLSETFPTVGEYAAQRTFMQAKWLLEEKKLRDVFAGGLIFEYSTEYQNAKGDSPYPFTTFGHQNYGVGYLSPENCDDINIPCDYNPEPCFKNLQHAITNVTILTETYDKFKIPESRQGRSKCPKRFPSIGSFQWTADAVPNIQCPKKGHESEFTCPANLSGLRHNAEPGSFMIGILKAIPFLFIVAVVYMLAQKLQMNIETMQRKRMEKGLPEEHWTKVIMPAVSRSCTPRGYRDGDSNSESSDESTGLLSMQGWNYGDVGRTRYVNVNSEITL